MVILMKILFLEGYYGGSHKAFAEGWEKRSRHNIEILSLPARKWKWRMQAGAWIFQEFLHREKITSKPDIIFATDMINLAEFLGLTRDIFPRTPAVLYFHENQFSYPQRTEEPDFTRAAINAASALAADRLIFNSDFNRKDFFRHWLSGNRKMPDHRISEKRIRQMEQNSCVVPVGVDLEFLDRNKRTRTPGAPLVLWNHRWEHDKGPETFFRVLQKLKDDGSQFRLAVCGENFSDAPSCFNRAKTTFSKETEHFGYLNSRDEYAQILWKSDIAVSCSRQEFLGLSVIEAMWCGCYPLLPNRLSYPEILPPDLHERHLYNNEKQLNQKLKRLVTGREPERSFPGRSDFLRRYDWRWVAEILDDLMDET